MLNKSSVIKLCSMTLFMVAFSTANAGGMLKDGSGNPVMTKGMEKKAMMMDKKMEHKMEKKGMMDEKMEHKMEKKSMMDEKMEHKMEKKSMMDGKMEKKEMMEGKMDKMKK